jgi:hypothetical protein
VSLLQASAAAQPKVIGFRLSRWEDDMKLSSLLCAAAVAVAALTLASDGAFAATAADTVATSRSNSFKAINPNDAAAVAACKKGGGSVGKDDKGNDACITPKKK